LPRRRNGLLLRPSQTYGRHSYAQIMLEPLADALRAAMAQTGRWDTNVWFSMQVRRLAAAENAGQHNTARQRRSAAGQHSAAPHTHSAQQQQQGRFHPNPWRACQRQPARRVCCAQGEMSATIMRFPRDWAALVAPIRGRMGRAAKVSMGIGLNFNRLVGAVDPPSKQHTQLAAPLYLLARQGP
jgi:hypothetical protein